MNRQTQNQGYLFRDAQAEDTVACKRLLSEAELPTEDLSDTVLEHFVVCLAHDEVVGVVGLEPAGAIALLRSLAVAKAHRSQGIAATLLSEALTRARACGVATLFTLTTTAKQFFEKHGFAVIGRARVPQVIRASTQFRTLCPDTAVCLVRATTDVDWGADKKSEAMTLSVARSVALFDSEFYCAESVLQAVAEAMDVTCKLIPQIATGLCSGVARSCGPCGAVLGGVLGIGLVLGRTSAQQTIEPAYEAVRMLLDRFEAEFGSSDCRDLLGCDLGTEQGQIAFESQALCSRCRNFVGRATQLALEAIEAHRSIESIPMETRDECQDQSRSIPIQDEG